MAHYGATKAGMEGFMKGVAIEAAKYGVTINAVRPGNILTAGLAKLGDDYLRNQVCNASV
jgi:3-oxoacyl-[acyl-carrier protein] reductase